MKLTESTLFTNTPQPRELAPVHGHTLAILSLPLPCWDYCVPALI